MSQVIDEAVLNRAIDLFNGNETDAREWLTNPVRGLNYQAPINCDRDDVLDLIGRIEHGVIS